MTILTCPYCKEAGTYDVDTGDFAQEMECSHCEQGFIVVPYTRVTFTVQCANGFHQYSDFFSKDVAAGQWEICDNCDDIRRKNPAPSREDKP